MNAYMQTIALIELSITCAIVIVWILQQFSTNALPFLLKVFLVISIGNLLFWRSEGLLKSNGISVTLTIFYRRMKKKNLIQKS